MHRKFLAAAVGVFAGLCILIFVTAYHGVHETEQVVSDQFNNQQLIIARKVAGDIRLHFQFLETALRTFSRGWENGPTQREQHANDAYAMSRLLKAWDVKAIGFVSADGEVRDIIMEGLPVGENLEVDFSPYLEWASAPEHRDRVLIGKTLQPDSGPFQNTWVMAMATPIYGQASLPDGTDTVESFSGLSFFIVDALGIAGRYSRNVRSGETGYAWVLDHQGNFMAHYEEDFVGQSSLTIRRARNPLISFERINELVVKHLLEGKEGTDWYTTGWHRGVISEMKKLMAYSPIILHDADSNGLGNIWSVGVVAPVDEVSGLLRTLLVRQWTMAGLILFVVFVALSMLLYISLRWSQVLQDEVAKKTEHLRHSETRLQQETEQLKESMTRLVETQEKLIRSERFAAIGQAAAHLSHEIKNPLMLIGGFARQVSRSLPDGNSDIRKLKIIEEETRRLENLIGDVRDFTRPSRPQGQWGDLYPCIRDTLELMENALASQNIHCEASLPDHPPQVWHDPRQMKQVLINMIKNALEAMPDGGTLGIAVQWDEEKMRVSISDTGNGMSPEALENLFQPFFTTKKKGTGLGLAVCNKIIEDHNGEIQVSSREGEGAVFTLVLPFGAQNPEKSCREDI